MKGFGTVVTGTLVSGRLADDDELVAAPGTRRVKVRGRAGPRPAAGRSDRRSAHGGQSGGRRGRATCSADRRSSRLTPSRRPGVADAVVEVLAGARPLKHGARVRFHQGTAEILGRVARHRSASGPGHSRNCAGGSQAVRAAAPRSAGGARRAATATSCAPIRRRSRLPAG